MIVNSRLRTQSSLDPRTHSKSKSGSSEVPQNSLEDHSSVKLSILVGESTNWPSFFCMSKDHAQLLIMHACIQNGNETAGVNGATASERDGTERNGSITIFLTPTVHPCTCTRYQDQVDLPSLFLQQFVRLRLRVHRISQFL